MEVRGFSFARTPEIIFAPAAIRRLPERLLPYGKTLLLVTGGSSLENSGRKEELLTSLKSKGIAVENVIVRDEPTPNLIDDAVRTFGGLKPDVVAAVGGGSVIDAGKAISAMLPLGEEVADYLEVVGTKFHDGIKVPFIAVPTTAGTGSEATKNAVLSRTGDGGFKRSLRHDNLVPDLAIIDPELMIGCPAVITAAGGLDAFTQLLESYVSTAASPMTDALAWSGMERVHDSFIPLCTGSRDDAALRGGMAYAALMSGITLANAGLGVVHGLASPLGALFGIPHGIACGTMLAVAVRATIKKLVTLEDVNGLKKYARVGALFTGCDLIETGTCCEALADLLDALVDKLKMPRLSSFGVKEDHLDRIIDEAGNKNNPAALDRGEMREMLRNRL